MSALTVQRPHDDARALGKLIAALTDSMGRGGLTRMATWLGMSPSNLSKRLASPAGPFDAPTMRATLLVQLLRDPSPNGEKPRQGYRIRQAEGQPRWAPALATTAKSAAAR